jgi:hypothetical protein
MTAKLIFVFKFIEPVFWMAQAWIIVNLINPRGSFQANIKALNWLLRGQGFDSQVKANEKAFKIWHRDLWVLFFLNPVIIILIHLI